jgi:hypothetical protein
MTLEKRNLSPADAAREARKLFANLTFVDLTAEKTLEAVDLIGKRTDVAGIAVHDFMHARAAEVFKAESIVTLNLKEFSRFTQLPLEVPTRALA